MWSPDWSETPISTQRIDGGPAFFFFFSFEHFTTGHRFLQEFPMLSFYLSNSSIGHPILQMKEGAGGQQGALCEVN